MLLDAVRDLLARTLDVDDLDRTIQRLLSLSPPAQKSAVNAGLILSDFSKKAAVAYFQAVPDVLRALSPDVPDASEVPDTLDGWVGMGIQIAEKSAATGIKFFRQGASVFSRIPDRNLQARFIAQGMVLARQDAHLAFEYYQQAPALLAAVPLVPSALARWAEQGIALGQQDYTLGVEYFRISPELLQVLPIHLLPRWVSVVLHISQGPYISQGPHPSQGSHPRSLYTALLFIRKSPAVFAGVTGKRSAPLAGSAPLAEVAPLAGAAVVMELLLALTAEIAAQRPDLAETVFTSAVNVLADFAAHLLDEVLLSRAMQIARFDAELAATFFQNGGNILARLGTSTSHFSAWVDEGIALLMADPIAARSYFALESKSAQTAIDRLRGGVSLALVTGTLTVFARALCGQPVAIAPCISDERGRSDAPTTDGQTIYLPAQIGYFPDDARNRAWYTVATAFQAGFLEFGTFSPLPLSATDLPETADLIESLQIKYQTRGGFSGLTSFFSLFPEPDFARALFEIAEGSRVEFHLKETYPGLRAALVQMREADLSTCRTLMGLTPRGAVVELLRQIALAGKTREAIPPELQALVFDACRMLGAVQSSEATVAMSMQAVARVYDLLRDESDLPEASGEMEPFEDRGPQRRGDGAGGGEIRPSTRGHLDPERVEKTQAAQKAQLQAAGLLKKLKEAGLDQVGAMGGPRVAPSDKADGVSPSTHADPAPLSALTPAEGDDAAPAAGAGPDDLGVRYDEWDVQADDYRPAWCRVIERGVPEGEGEAVTVSTCGARLILTAFERMRPVGLARVRGARDGDAFDLDRLVSARVAVRMRQTPSDRIYIQHQRKERSVAAAFLIDLSGSTGQQIADGGRTILQVEKEALTLLSRAMDLLGDRFALFGFSGRGKEAVDFQVVKSFEERAGAVIDRRIGRLQSGGQNRDGAALRHAARRLAAQPEKIKTLFLISDGKPLDDAYEGGYAMADTKRALREAKQAGIHPFCITVDRAGAEYVRGMYGDVDYLVIDRIETLPLQLPRIYKRLTT